MSGALAQHAGAAYPAADKGQGMGDVLASIRRMIANEGEGEGAPLGPVGVLRLDAAAQVGAEDGTGEDCRDAGIDQAADDAVAVAPVGAVGSAAEPSGPAMVPPALDAAGPQQGRDYADVPPAINTLRDDQPVRDAHALGAVDDQPVRETPASVTVIEAEAIPTAATELPFAPAESAIRAADPQASIPTPLTEVAMSPVTLSPVTPSTTAPARSGTGAAAEDGGSILTTIIRDVIRQELTGDGSGRMAADLRGMILREVGRILTDPSGPRPV